MIKLTTNHGDILVELDAEKAPLSAANFEQYVRDGHYDGTLFHRVINGFMIQGGGMNTDFIQKPTRAPVLADEPGRYASVYHLLSLTHNRRLRARVHLDGPQPMVDSVVDLWSVANWFEREAFDLFGILYRGHPDLRRILTDYGFVGHPFRKDFPISGHVEMRYDPELRRVVYEPVSIEPRVLVPRVIRSDSRYAGALLDRPDA